MTEKQRNSEEKRHSRDLERHLEITDVLKKIKTDYSMDPALEEELYPLIERIDRSYIPINELPGKRILDLGAGSTSYSGDSATPREYEPWLSRALYELGAQPVAVDIGDLSQEKFEHHKVDLSKPGALNFMPSESFDGIIIRGLITSPLLQRMLDKPGIERMKQEFLEQTKRLLKPGGKEIFKERWWKF